MVDIIGLPPLTIIEVSNSGKKKKVYMIVKIIVFVTSNLPNLGKVTSMAFIVGLYVKL